MAHAQLNCDTLSLDKTTKMGYIIVMKKTEYEITLDKQRKQREKDVLIEGIFMGIMIGSLFMAIMVHFLQSL